jgi:heme a synthase
LDFSVVRFERTGLKEVPKIRKNELFLTKILQPQTAWYNVAGGPLPVRVLRLGAIPVMKDFIMALRSLFKGLNRFQKTALVTIGVTFLLIFIGGLVRATGAGLGCPDWPRCFGLWIPPTSVAGLPDAYDPEQFNVFKTWMEYVNRLVGVLVGFLILLTFVFSVRHMRRTPSVFAGATAALLLVLFQGWLGGQVVQSGLQSGMITIHMVVAVLILNVLVWTWFRSVKERVRYSLGSRARRNLIVTLFVLLTVIIVQVVFGSQVREALEMVKAVYPGMDRNLRMEQVGSIDMIHRTFSWLVLAFVLLFQYLAIRHGGETPLPFLAGLTTAAALLQMLLGAALVYLGIPPAAQVFHLWIAAIMTAVPFLALLVVLRSRPGLPSGA